MNRKILQIICTLLITLFTLITIIIIINFHPAKQISEDISITTNDKNQEQTHEQIEEINIKIKDNTLSNSGLTLILDNNSNKDYTYGPEYYIEKLNNSTWMEPRTISGDPLVWNSIGYPLKAGETKEQVIDFNYSYGQLSPGTYRIIKRVFKNEDIPITENEIKKIKINFEIVEESQD